MKLLFAYYTHKPGGFCGRLYRAMSACESAGHEVTYATLDAPPIDLEGVRVVRIPFPLSRRKGLMFWLLFTLWIPLYLIYVTRCLRPDRLVPFGAYYAAAMLPSGWLFNRPRILFLRSLTFRIDILLGKPWLVRACARSVDFLGIRSATRVVCMSEAMRYGVSRFTGRDMAGEPVLMNDVPAFSSTFDLESRGAEDVDQGITCVTAGVLDARKNVSILLDAIALIDGRRGARPPVKLMVFGEGALRGALEAKARAMDLGHVVSFAGWVPNPLATTPRNSLLLHPSLHEGVPNVVMEALAQGLSVVLSDIPEHRELVSYCSPKGEVARIPLLDPLDAAGWADFIERYRDTLAIRSELAAHSRILASALKFDWDQQFVKIVSGSDSQVHKSGYLD